MRLERRANVPLAYAALSPVAAVSVALLLASLSLFATVPAGDHPALRYLWARHRIQSRMDGHVSVLRGTAGFVAPLLKGGAGDDFILGGDGAEDGLRHGCRIESGMTTSSAAQTISRRKSRG